MGFKSKLCLYAAIGALVLSACGGSSGNSNSGSTTPPAVDTIAPSVSFNVASLTVESGMTGVSNLTATDNVGVTTGPTVTCTNGGSFSGSIFTAPIVTSDVMSVCTAIAGDAAGNEGTGSLNVTITAPIAINQNLDLLGLPTTNGFLRASGSGIEGDGRFGLPVAGGHDLDGDGHNDFARSNMLLSPLGRTRAGGVDIIFGDSLIEGGIDLAVANPRILSIYGDGIQEATGGEIWMADLTGDGLGELIIGRPNFRGSSPDRIGAGALTIIMGSPELRTMAINGTPLDLRLPPAGVNVFTIVGAAELDRMGFWMREGDVTGDGIDDIVVGADQEDNGGATNSGAAYVIRGGSHLDANMTIDLAGFGTTALAGNIFKISPPAGSEGYHFGSTVAMMDLDSNGRDEVLVSSSLNRAGGVLLAEDAPIGSAEGSGANIGGTLFILWDDNVPTGPTWPAGLDFTMGAFPASSTRIDGGTVAGQFTNDRFGEDMLGGLDYDGDQSPDLFIGDITGQALDRNNAGLGHLFFSAANLKNRNFNMGNVPSDINVSTFFGPEAGAISSDTLAHGDFDNDGFADLAIGSPTANPLGRISAGIMHIVWGKAGPWPNIVDFQEGLKTNPADLQITDVLGAFGQTTSNDRGDTLMYSATAGDMDNDGRDDLIINEMRGNGVAASTIDVGNLLIISGAAIPKD